MSADGLRMAQSHRTPRQKPKEGQSVGACDPAGSRDGGSGEPRPVHWTPFKNDAEAED